MVHLLSWGSYQGRVLHQRGYPFKFAVNTKNLKVLEYVEYWTTSVSNMNTILRLNSSCIGLSPKEEHRICRFSKFCLMMQQRLCDSLLITVIQQYILLKGKKNTLDSKTLTWSSLQWTLLKMQRKYFLFNKLRYLHFIALSITLQIAIP